MQKLWYIIYQLWDETSGNLAKWFVDPGTGAAQVSLKGQVSGTTTAVELGAAGEIQTLLVGQDEGSNADIVRTDPNRILWMRPRTVWQDVNPVEIPSTEGDLWAPGGTSAEEYELEFYVVNNDAASSAVTVSVGLDLGAVGSLAAPEYWIFNEVVPYPGNLGWRGPFIMRGDDAVRGIASVANDASIHFRIKRVDTGA
jgi:hypothetical protein